MIENGRSTAATFKGAETDIYNQSLRNLTTTKKKLIAVYRQALNSIEVDLQRLKGTSRTFTITRLEAMQKKVIAEIAHINRTNQAIITSGYIRNFDLSYYGTGFEYERAVNAQFGAVKSGTHFNLGYTQIDKNFVIASLNKRIAGETFGERMTSNILKLRQELRQSIGVAMIRGDSAVTTARNLQSGITGIGDAMTKSVNSSLRIARTELLKAYSLGQEISSNQAEAAGVDITPTWDSTLDGKTRPAHQTADGKKFILDNRAEWILTVGGVVFSSPRLPLYSAGGSTAKQVINCRCRKINNPFGFQSVSRVARQEDGTWETVNGDLNYPQWAKTLPARKEIDRTIADRSLRARELRIMRKPNITTEDRRTLADIRKQIKGRVIGNVGTRTNIA